MTSYVSRGERISTTIRVAVTTVLDNRLATIVDLTEQGAQLRGVSLEKGTRFQIDYGGQTVFAVSRWCEVDRTGCEFPFGLPDGPLLDQLQRHRAALAARRVLRSAASPVRPIARPEADYAARH